MEWKVKTTRNSFANFKQFFINRALVVRNRDKHKKTKVKETGFHSANSAMEMEERLTDKMALAFKELAVATEETINLAIGTKTNPSSAKSLDEKLAVALLQHTKEVAKLKKSKKSYGGGGGRGGGPPKEAAVETDEKPKCKHCGRPHLDKVPEDKCFKREENASTVPDWNKRMKARQEEKAAAKK